MFINLKLKIIYFIYVIKKKCKGKGRNELKTNIFYITDECSKEIKHIEKEYSEFVKLKKKENR